MNIKSMKRTLLLLAFSMGALSVAGGAQAQYSVILDCHGDGGLPSWAQTTDKITIKVYVHGYEDFTAWTTRAILCDKDEQLILQSNNFKDARDVTKITISTSGHNTYWLDKLLVVGRIYRQQWGVDNNVGWCFSKDPLDGNRPYCWKATAYPSVDFDNPDN